MSLITFGGSGDFSKSERFLAKLQHGNIYHAVNALAEEGVTALSSATPVESGVTAASWSSEVQFSLGGCRVWWRNNHLDSEGTPIAVMLELGHGTGTGGYVQGRDFINPAIRPVFDRIADAVWREVTTDG